MPKLIDRPVPKADAAGLERLDTLMGQLTARELAPRLAALTQVAQVDASWLPALIERFERVADRNDKLAMKELLERVRERARAELGEARKAAGQSGPTPTYDYLELLVRARERSSRELRALTEVVAYSRMFERIGDLAAARRLVQVYVRFGEFLRADTELALARLGDRAVAALVEAKGHPVVRISLWAQRQLEKLGRSTPGETLELTDPLLRADVLRAYGRIRPLEVLPLLVSYSSSELRPPRAAAREALTKYGEAALWALRDGYERSGGERAPLDWSWQRLARELFLRFDRQRQGDVYALLERGQRAGRDGDLAAACTLFEQVLAREPEPLQGPTLAETFLRCAAASADRDAQGALLLASRAERLEPTGPVHDRALSLRQTLEAEALLARGLVDRTLLERARTLDPENARAAALLEQVGSETRWRMGPWGRYAGALVIGVLAALGLAWLLLRQRQREPGDA